MQGLARLPYQDRPVPSTPVKQAYMCATFTLIRSCGLRFSTPGCLPWQRRHGCAAFASAAGAHAGTSGGTATSHASRVASRQDDSTPAAASSSTSSSLHVQELPPLPTPPPRLGSMLLRQGPDGLGQQAVSLPKPQFLGSQLLSQPQLPPLVSARLQRSGARGATAAAAPALDGGGGAADGSSSQLHAFSSSRRRNSVMLCRLSEAMASGSNLLREAEEEAGAGDDDSAAANELINWQSGGDGGASVRMLRGEHSRESSSGEEVEEGKPLSGLSWWGAVGESVTAGSAAPTASNVASFWPRLGASQHASNSGGASAAPDGAVTGTSQSRSRLRSGRRSTTSGRTASSSEGTAAAAAAANSATAWLAPSAPSASSASSGAAAAAVDSATAWAAHAAAGSAAAWLAPPAAPTGAASPSGVAAAAPGSSGSSLPPTGSAALAAWWNACSSATGAHSTAPAYSAPASSAPASSAPATSAPAHSTAPAHSAPASSAPASSTLSPRDPQDLLEELAERLLDEQEIDLPQLRFGTQRTACPECEGGSQGEDCFSITLSEDGGAVWKCFRATCGHKGGMRARGWSASGAEGPPAGWGPIQPKAPPVKPDTSRLKPLSPQLLSWFASRGIGAATLRRNGVAMERRYINALEDHADCIAFPYRQNNEIVNIKYRALPKRFTQTKGGVKMFYGLDDVAGESEVIIVEGEMDKLALEEAGFRAVISVPNGAAGTRGGEGLPRSGHDLSFGFVADARQALASCRYVIMATDADGPGDALASELQQRLQDKDCMRLGWQNLQGLDGKPCKDANEALQSLGPQGLRQWLLQLGIGAMQQVVALNTAPAAAAAVQYK